MNDTPSTNNAKPLIGLGAGVAAAAVVAGGAVVLAGAWRLHTSAKRGREVSLWAITDRHALTTFTRHGHTGDPINLQIVGTAAQVGAAFAEAGWYRADEIDLVTSARICADSVFARSYSTAPVSSLYLFGRKEDLAFERPGANVRQRDHARFWRLPELAKDGRPIWLGGATRDTAVELAKTNHLPTHRIAPDVDDERNLVVADLSATSMLAETDTRPGFGKATDGVNGGGDSWHTDGQVALLTLVDEQVPPLSIQARGRLGVQIVQVGLRLSRRIMSALSQELPFRKRVTDVSHISASAERATPNLAS